MKGLLFFVLVYNLSSNADLVFGQTAVAATGKPVILVINSFDAHANKYRKNKKELFAELADSLKSYLAAKIISLELGTPEIIEELMPPGFDSTSLLDSLFKQYHASTAVVIKSLNVFFQNSGETVERDSDGKNRKTIRYDLCTAIEYVVYVESILKKDTNVEDCEFLTDRTSTGTFSIQTGPDIVGKKKHTHYAVKRNAEKFVKYDL